VHEELLDAAAAEAKAASLAAAQAATAVVLAGVQAVLAAGMTRAAFLLSLNEETAWIHDKLPFLQATALGESLSDVEILLVRLLFNELKGIQLFCSSEGPLPRHGGGDPSSPRHARGSGSAGGRHVGNAAARQQRKAQDSRGNV
jgi:hypothetical protein